VSARVLVRVGDQEIDFNQNFVLFMMTRNGEAKFTPDLCSRVTFVNFTVTQSSLENQCQNIYLKHERRDIEEKRIELLKLKGEYTLQLRLLEDDLLNKISQQGEKSILENEPLMKTLEDLKQ
jgi:dynein heavy chain 1